MRKTRFNAAGRKQDRQKAAAIRAEERAKRTPAQQIALLQKRPGNSLREITRLTVK